MTTTKIDLKHIARVEGYGRLVVDIENKRVKESKFMVLEGARFFEGIVTGKKYHEVPIIISRICAICSASHSVVSTYAIENAQAGDVVLIAGKGHEPYQILGTEKVPFSDIKEVTKLLMSK